MKNETPLTTTAYRTLDESLDFINSLNEDFKFRILTLISVFSKGFTLYPFKENNYLGVVIKLPNCNLIVILAKTRLEIYNYIYENPINKTIQKELLTTILNEKLLQWID